MKYILTIMMLSFIGFHNPTEGFFKHEVTGSVTDADIGKALPQVTVLVKGSSTAVLTDSKGAYKITVPDKHAVLVFRFLGYTTEEVKVGDKMEVNVSLKPDSVALGEVVVTEYKRKTLFKRSRPMGLPAAPLRMEANFEYDETINFEGEHYAGIIENGFKSAWKNPLSTFSIDVDAASYSNLRRYLTMDMLPPKDAVKIEEMINYFDYDYAAPKKGQPFSVYHEMAKAPWNDAHYLLHIGLQGEKIDMEDLPASNIVFLLDVSGSMNSPNKLPLLKKSLKLLINELRAEDKVSIVVYAGAAGEVLPATPGNDKKAILAALDALSAGGSTAGGAGIKLAYQIAQEHFIEGGNNRIVLATDGDFNVGAASDKAMEDLIVEKRKSGVFLTVLGFGMGNYQDAKCEILADKGNGNHAYIDNLLEAKKVLVNEFGGTFVTIAKDVKMQVEFNPATVEGYRLIGYENRLLAAEDFNDDSKDAGEMGAGHTVTALYEIIPKGAKSSFKPLDELKYQQRQALASDMNTSDLLTLKLRYKSPHGEQSKYLDRVVHVEDLKSGNLSNDFKWSAAVAAFGMKIRNSDYAKMDYKDVLSLAVASQGNDENGYRAELINLIKRAELIASIEE